MIHVRHAAAAIESGLCKTVLITHGESGRSGVGHTRNVTAPASHRRPVRAALWADGAADFVHDPLSRYMKTYGLTHEQLAMVSVMQRELAARNPRTTSRHRSPSRMC
jgi:acetyl-CoA acetyltransferase